jgi:hypothetical protein
VPFVRGGLRHYEFSRRYFAIARDGHVIIAARASLYIALADLALRAANQWSASGKAFPGALTAFDRVLAGRAPKSAKAENLARGGSSDAIIYPTEGLLRRPYRISD